MKELLERMIERIQKLERRVAELEKDSHPPIDLTPFIEREVARQLKERGVG